MDTDELAKIYDVPSKLSDKTDDIHLIELLRNKNSRQINDPLMHTNFASIESRWTRNIDTARPITSNKSIIDELNTGDNCIIFANTDSVDDLVQLLQEKIALKAYKETRLKMLKGEFEA